MAYELNPNKEKVFGIGLGRTGTTSLHHALLHLGYSSAHWQNRSTRLLLDYEDYYAFDAATDITVSANFEALFFAFSRAKFIYTIRSLYSWVKSVSAHYEAETPASGGNTQVSYQSSVTMLRGRNKAFCFMYIITFFIVIIALGKRLTLRMRSV